MIYQKTNENHYKNENYGQKCHYNITLQNNLVTKIDLIVFFFVLFSGENLTDPTRPTFRYSLHCSQLKTADPELNRKP